MKAKKKGEEDGGEKVEVLRGAVEIGGVLEDGEVPGTGRH